MENFEFKSAVCTTKEQSEKLLALGLKKETADMMYITSTIDGLGKPITEEYRYYTLIPEYYESSVDIMLHIPAWSLARLFEISNSAIHIGLPAMIDRQQPYDYLITTIEDYIKRDCFNKDYLEEKK